MPYLTTKRKNQRNYLYLEEKARINGKVRRVNQIYLGPEDQLDKRKISAILSKFNDDIELAHVPFGISAAVWQIACEIDLPGKIDAVAGKSRHQNLTLGEYMTIAAINRLAGPCSKRQLPTWFAKDWLHFKYDVDPKVLNAQTYWNHFQALDDKKITEIELAINKVVIDTFKLDIEHLLFDPTNFYTFSRSVKRTKLLWPGHSKENRSGLRLVNYSLLCTRDHGVPLMHHAYPGNDQDAKAFKKVPKQVADRIKALGSDPANITLVFDKGNHSPKAFKALDGKQIGFIASARNSMLKDLLHVADDKFTKAILPVSGKAVEYYKTKRKFYNDERTIFVIIDPAKRKKQVIDFQAKLKKKIKNIKAYFKNRLNNADWSDKAVVEKKVASMIGRAPFVAVIVAVVSGPDGNLTLDVTVDKIAQATHEETLGRSIIFTNRHDWTPEEVIWSYREQYVVEHAFREMKCPHTIAIRPMYHRADACVRAHVFTCVLALLLLSLLRLKLARNNMPGTYDSILDTLRTVDIIKIFLTPGATPLLKLAQLSPDAKKIAQFLKLKKLV
jgi:transposase